MSKYSFLILAACLCLTFAGGIRNHNRGCIWSYNGQCSSECPVGTHSFVSRCGGITPSAPTCSDPEVRDLGPICDMSRCDCDTPTVLNEATGKCVQPQDCPK